MAMNWQEVRFTAPGIPGVGPRSTPATTPSDAIASRVQFLSTGLNWWSINRRIRISLGQIAPRAERLLRSHPRSSGVPIFINFQEIRNEWLTQYMYISHNTALRVFASIRGAVTWIRSTPTVTAAPPQGNMVQRMFWGQIIG